MGKKDYKKGLADAMEAYESFGRKQEAAIRRVGEEVAKTAGKVDKLGGKIGEITDYITDKEKAELYKLNTPVDIADLDDAEKRILLATLYQLSADEAEVTEEQQNYVRAVQQYLKIYNPQTEIDLSAVENIEDISTQKAVLQASLEFFRLGTHPDELTEEQEDFLDYFQVNRRTRREINGCIEVIVEAVGIRGLSEKYGFVAAQPHSEFARYKDNGPIPEKVADICISQLGKHWLQDIPYRSERRFLETQDYLIYYQGKHDGDSSLEGLYRVEKQTGDIKRMPFDLDGFLSFFGHISYYIQSNIIYWCQLTEAPRYRYKVDLYVLNFDEEVCQKIKLPFPDLVSLSTRFHISGNDTYLVIHSSEIEVSSNLLEDKSGKTYVIDLVHGERAFLLEPPMEVIIDAFIWDGKFLFSGKINAKDSKVSLYQYNIENKTLDDLFHPTGNIQAFYSVLSKILGTDTGTLNTNSEFYYHMIREIRYISGNYYILMWEGEYSPAGADVLYCLPDNYLETTRSAAQSIATYPYFRYDSAIFFKGLSAYRYDFSTLEVTCIDQNELEVKYNGDFTYFLLGDYLYKHIRNTNEWFRTNISTDWDNLQWEIMRGFDKMIR